MIGLAYKHNVILGFANNNFADFRRLDNADIRKTAKLETDLNQSMFSPNNYGDSEGIEAVVHWVKKQPMSEKLSEQFDMGCGSPYSCGE